MEKFFEPLLTWLESLATTTSLEFFVFIAAFLEEIIAPIPSPFVMTTAAVLAKVQNYSLLQIAILVILASLAKTASSYLIYVLADKAEDVVVGKFGKYFGVTTESIERIGKMLSKTWWDDVLLFLSRAIPLIPTSVVTVVAGMIKYEPRSFLLMTFLGTIIRNIFYLWVAYFGIDVADAMIQRFAQNPAVLVVLFLIGVAGLYFLWKMKDKIWDRFLSKKS